MIELQNFIKARSFYIVEVRLAYLVLDYVTQYRYHITHSG